MARKKGGCWNAVIALALSLSLGGISTSLQAANVGLAGVLGSKAMLVIDGGSPRTLAVGQEYHGVKLVSVHGDHVKVEVGGKVRTLRIGENAVADASPSGKATVVLSADSRGHFETMGAINGVSIRFLVDTGATGILLGGSDAKRLGIDITKAQRLISQTANGNVVVYRVKFDKVQVGDIVLYGVEGAVNPGLEMSSALLGMSFLNRTDMQREGDKMTLRKRF